MPASSIGQLVAREDHNPEVEHLLGLIQQNKEQLRELLMARERQLRFVARLSGTGGWTLLLAPLRFRPSIEWLELHGYSPGDKPTVKMALRRVQAPDRKPLIDMIRRCMSTGEPADIVVRVEHLGGQTIFMRMITEAVYDAQGAVNRIEGACQDVTVQVRREQELASHRDSLEELVEQRTRDLQTFSHALAHDLRAPIAAMAGFAQVVGSRPLADNDETRHRLERIVANAHRAEAMIEGILRLINHLQGPLDLREVDITALANAALDQLRSAEAQRQVETVVQEHMVAQGDPGLLMSVIGNLVNNAWKFSSRRADARIEIGRADDGTFFVRDNGVGFDAQHASRLFRPLERLHHGREFNGLGIGLATANRIVQRHGGRMWAESSPGAGATFWFTLPDSAAR